MKLRTYGLFGTRIVVDLPDDGDLTPEARWVFTNGHCHSFALALRKLTGWKLVAQEGPRGVVLHVLVARADRSPLVVVDAAKSLVLPQRGPNILGFHCKFRGRGWLKPEVEKLMPFALRRLEEIQHESGNAHYETKPPSECMQALLGKWPRRKSTTSRKARFGSGVSIGHSSEPG